VVGNAINDLVLAIKDAIEYLSYKGSEMISVKDFGAVGDGSVDDTASIQAGIDSFGVKGGSLYIPATMRCRVAGTLTVKENVTLRGPHNGFINCVSYGGVNTYDVVGGALLVASTATIQMYHGAALWGLLIQRYGMVTPVLGDAAFAGTAVTYLGNDCSVQHCTILGFNLAITSQNNSWRPRASHVNIDCKSGLDWQHVFDIAYADHVECWPFASVYHPSYNDASSDSMRSGTAFYFHDTNDWSKLLHCFSYNYQQGFVVHSADDMILNGCSSDGNPVTAASSGRVGLTIDGTALRTRVFGYQCASQFWGVHIDTTGDVTIEGVNTRAVTDHGIIINSGNVTLQQAIVEDSTNGITINNASSLVAIGKSIVKSTVTNKILIATATDTGKVRIANDNSFPGAAAGTNVVVGTLTDPVIASAATLNLPTDGDVFEVSGTTGITAVSGGIPGSMVTLKFQGALTVTDSANLNLVGNFVTAANSTLVLIRKSAAGTWQEISRSSP
jgi:hypothetical protein